MTERDHDQNVLKFGGGSPSYIEDTNPVFSKQGTQEDYIHLDGIKNRTGVTKDNLYALVTKEFNDNALDYEEISGVKDPWVDITITKEDQFLKIAVKNPVAPNNNIIFSKEMLESIYNFRTYYSSKRVHKIHRGALGDASKLVLGIPYALADVMGIPNINRPLTIRTCNNNVLRTFHVGLALDTMLPDIDEASESVMSNENYTEVENILPLNNNEREEEFTTGRLLLFLRNYALLNTHIGFTFNVEHRQIRLPATETIINSGKNKSSIYFYYLNEFSRFIKNLDNDNQITYDMLCKTFREASNLPKNKLTQMTVSELKSSATAIEEIYNQLNDVMPPVSRQTGLSSFLPFDTNKKFRKRVLEERLIQVGIFCKLVKYKQIHGYHISDVAEDGSKVEYPYFIEVLIAHSSPEYVSSNLQVIQAINSTIGPNRASELFGRTLWYNSGKEYVYKDQSIFNVLEHYGYKDSSKGCKKPNSIVIINLVSPKIQYNNFSKTQIDTSPFADAISEVLDKVCKGGISSDDRPDKTKVLEDVLRERMHKWFSLPQDNLVILKKHEWTQSDVFYATRKRLIEVGYDSEEIDREYITGLISPTCANKLGVAREQIGIFAADRAQLYFKGKWTDVGLDEIETQVDYGTDMVIIEKEGVISQIGLFADTKGIALLNTRGFLTDYASKLAKLASEKGCNIAILTDFDVSGLLIFLKVRKLIPDIERIGVDFKTIEDLGLREEDVREEYKAPEKHLNALEKELTEALDYYGDLHKALNNMLDDGPNTKNLMEYAHLKQELKYLKTKRIEINSVMFQLDDNAAFWDWIAQELRSIFPYRDFNRSVDIPEYVLPESLQQLNDVVEEKGKLKLKDQREKLQERLSDSGIEHSFLFDRTNNVLPDYNIKNYDVALADQSRRIIENDPDIKPMLEGIKKLLPTAQQENGEGRGDLK